MRLTSRTQLATSWVRLGLACELRKRKLDEYEVPNRLQEPRQLIPLLLFTLDARQNLTDVAAVVPVVEDTYIHPGLQSMQELVQSAASLGELVESFSFEERPTPDSSGPRARCTALRAGLLGIQPSRGCDAKSCIIGAPCTTKITSFTSGALSFGFGLRPTWRTYALGPSETDSICRAKNVSIRLCSTTASGRSRRA